MKKLLVLAALAGGMFTAAPVTVAQAAPLPAKCLILPLLQADCRAAISDAIKIKAPDADTSAVWDGVSRIPSPLYWLRCKPNTGTNPLFVCD
jgi:hypothetical protein